MAKHVLQVIDGPDKPALQWALSYPEQEQVHFTLDYDGVDARILRMMKWPTASISNSKEF